MMFKKKCYARAQPILKMRALWNNLLMYNGVHDLYRIRHEIFEIRE